MKFVGLFVIVVIAMMFVNGAPSKHSKKSKSKSSKKSSGSSESSESCDLCNRFEDGFNATAATLAEILESTGQCAAGNSATCPPTTTCPTRSAAVVYVAGDVVSADTNAIATCPDGYIVVDCTPASIDGVYLGPNAGPDTDPKNCVVLFKDPGNYQAVATCVLKDDDETVTYKKYVGGVGDGSEVSCPAGEELIQCFLRTRDFYADPIVDKANNKCSCETSPNCRTNRALCKATAP